MEAYLTIGKVLDVKGEYKQAIFAFKRLLQVSWSSQNYNYEMAAYEQIGKM